MNKKELASGMVVEVERLGYGVIVGQRILFKDSYLCLGDIKDDLTSEYNKALDIIGVYTIKFLTSLSKLENISEDDLVLIWKRKKEINWKKVPKFTPVQVKDGDAFINRYFLDFYEKDYYRYVVTKCDKYTFSSLEIEKEIYIENLEMIESIEDDYIEKWHNCRIHPDVEIKEEWYK